MLAEALLPIVVYTVFGILLRAIGIVRADLAPVVFRFIFVATLPALVFTSIARAPLDADAALLPVAGFSTNIICALVAYLFGRLRGMDSRRTGALVLSASVINMMLMYPFVLFIVGEEALRMAILFDIGNAVFVSTLASSLAIRFGRESSTRLRHSALEILKQPILMAVVAALIINLAALDVSPLVYAVTEPLGQATMPLTLVALGIALSPKAFRGPIPLAAICLRMGVGLAAGMLLSTLLDLQGLTRWIVIASAAAPIGFGSVALTAVGKLDVEHAATAATLSVTLGLFTITGLLWLARQTSGV